MFAIFDGKVVVTNDVHPIDRNPNPFETITTQMVSEQLNWRAIPNRDPKFIPVDFDRLKPVPLPQPCLSEDYAECL